MTEHLSQSSTLPPPAGGWGVDLEAAVCEACDWAFLLPAGSLPADCPHCFSPLSGDVDLSPDHPPPELFLPFAVSHDVLAQRLEGFGRGIPFAPPDLKPERLVRRLRRLFLPLWLVDSEVRATWQAEAGFDYEVVSYRDRFEQNRGGWTSQRVTETRIRWEPRLGRLARTYHNVPVPALEEEARLAGKLGEYDLAGARPYQAEALNGGSVRLPSRPPSGAWPEARPAIQAAAAQECRQAAGADHIRDFRWQAEFPRQNWTLLLRPLYTTYYLDDDGRRQVVLIHGRSARISGARRASLRRARRLALIVAAVAGAILFLSLIAALGSLLDPRLGPLAGAGIALAVVVTLSAIVPIAIAWQFNRAQGGSP